MLQVLDISHSYEQRSWWNRTETRPPILEDISINVEKGCCLGLLGSSGAGKSTLGKIMLGLQRPSKGQVLFEGCNLYSTNRGMPKHIRRDMQVVFQDCYSAVNPMMTAAQIIGEPLRNFERLSPTAMQYRIEELLEQVGLLAEDGAKRPEQFSGGQLQRVNIARAIALKPKLIVLDESISSLDVVHQVHILNLLAKLKAEHGLSYVFITHDIQAAMSICDRIAVMEQGRIVHYSDEPNSLFLSDHPAVKTLVSAILPNHPADRAVARGMNGFG